MHILIIGSGGRENALAWKISQSKRLSKLFIAPGNPGTALYGQNIDIGVEDFDQLATFSKENAIDIIIVGPELPLTKGIKDFFQSHQELKHISIIGPDKKGAILEGSKDFSKAFMKKYAIPTAAYQTFSSRNLAEGLKYIETQKPPFVLKADGLAAGKGVIITSDPEEAKTTLEEMITNLKFGEASSKVVIEEFLDGIEVSVFILSDGIHYIILPEAKDYKRIGEGDTGPNTGGMGAVSPVYFANNEFMAKVERQIIKPTVEGLRKEGIDYKGFIFFGLIMVANEPYLIEYNCRLGDPETEVIMPRIKNDLLDILSKVENQTLDKIKIEFEDNYATTVMCVAGGYPEKYEKGDVITGMDRLSDVIAFHAGTALNHNNEIVTHGGRVMALTAIGNTMHEALSKSNQAAENIHWKGKYFRKDIGFDVNIEIAG